MNRFKVRDHAPSILVSSLSAAFGVALLQTISALAKVVSARDPSGASDDVRVTLASIAFVVIALATYVGAIVTANTFSTIIAGRTRTIALMRLVGASARSQRQAVAREGLLVGIIGAVLGVLVGTLVTFTTLSVAVATGFVQQVGFSYLEPVILIPVVGVVLTTWIASWVGSRRVLQVSPMQAIGASHERTADAAAHHRGRNIVSIVLFVLGFVLLGLGIVAGFISSTGVLIGVVGGMLSFTGLVLGSQLIMPRALRLVGRLLGRSASARLAAENAVRFPERSSRTTIGIVIGITLVTMFGVASGTLQGHFDQLLGGQPGAAPASQRISVAVGIFSVLIGFSALIAAVGLVNNLSLSVLQRTRELGLLRALGFTARQVRGMIVAESAQLTTAAVLIGFVLGTFYGWAGAQSLLGAVTGAPAFVAPVIPVALLVVIVVGAAVLTAVASIAPARRATKVSPVVALAAH